MRRSPGECIQRAIPIQKAQIHGGGVEDPARAKSSLGVRERVTAGQEISAKVTRAEAGKMAPARSLEPIAMAGGSARRRPLLTAVTLVAAVTLLAALAATAPLAAAQEVAPPSAPADPRQLAAAERRLSTQVRALLRHYQQKDPVGIPGAPVPDPFPAPDTERSMGFATVTVKDTMLHGLSRFRIDKAMLDLANMSVSLALRLEHLELEGAYQVRYWLTRSAGRLNVTLDGVRVRAAAALAVARDGRLRPDTLSLAVEHASMRVHIENEALSALARGVLEAAAPLLYESAKPFIIMEAQKKAREELERECDKLPQKFPNSLSPLDLVVWDARKLLTHMGFDPYSLPAKNVSAGPMQLYVSNIWLTGLSSFHRAGAARLGFEKHVFRAALRLGTGVLAGQCDWRVDFFSGYITRTGFLGFSIDYVEAMVALSQPLDTRHHPRLDRFELSLGQFAVRVAGAGTLDYAAEAVANVLPNLLRSHIRDIIEAKVREGVQEALSRIDVEELIEQRLKDLDDVQAAAAAADDAGDQHSGDT